MKKIFKYLCGGLMMLWLGGGLLPTKAMADVITMKTVATEIRMTVFRPQETEIQAWNIKVDFGDGEITDYECGRSWLYVIEHTYDNTLVEKTITITTTTYVRELRCGGNQLISLDVSGCTSLWNLSCSENQLISLDVSGCTSLIGLSCSKNQLTSLDVSGCPSLQTLSCYNNQLISLDVSGYTSLQTLSCYNNQLISLDVSGCTSLENLYCYDNQLISLSVSGCTSLENLYCSSNPLEYLDVSNLSLTHLSVPQSLKSLNCSNNKLSNVQVASCRSLEFLDCSGNQMPDFWDICHYNYPSLVFLNCSNNQMTYLDVHNLSALETLNCSGNQLRLDSLYVGGCTSLRALNCSNNQLISLGVGRCTSLETLDCSENRLSSLNLYSLTNLKNLVCDGNAITNLLLYSGVKLSSLSARDNKLMFSSLESLLSYRHNTASATLSPQHNAKALTVGENWDLTSEMTIDGATTAYTLTDETGAPVSEAACVEKDGVFRFRQSGKYILTLTNPQVTDYVSGVADEPVKIIYEMTVSGTDIAVYMVDAAPNAVVGGTVSGGGLFESGDEVVLTAVPSGINTFAYWADADGNVKSSENPYTFAVTSDVALTAVFKIYHTVAVAAPAGGTASQSGSGRYEEGETVTVTATPAEGYTFMHWADAAGNVKSVENPYTFAVTSDVALTAVFKQIIYHTLEVVASDGGTASQSGSGRYEEGETVTVTATPAEGYTFMHWADAAGNVKSMENPYTFAVMSDVALTAVFKQIIYHTLEVVASDGGTASQSGNGRYEAGETVTATPSSGFRFVNWERMAEQTVFATEAEYTFQITEDLVLKANFAKVDDPDDPNTPDDPDDPDDPNTPDDPDDPTTPDDPTAIEDLTVGAAPVVYVKEHTVYVTDDTAEVRVYTLGGLCVYSGRATAIPIRQSGVYVVSVGGRRCKILIP